MSHNNAETLGKIQTAVAAIAVEADKAVSGNKSAAVRARVQASAVAKLLKQFRVEMLPLTK